VFFSILGIREKHDQMVGIPNSYKKIQKAISLFAKIHPKTSIFLNVPMSYDLLSDLATLNKDFKDLPITAIRLSQLNFLTSKELHAHGAVAEKNHLKIKTPVSFLTDDSHQDLGQLIQSSNFEELTIPWHHDVNLTHDEVSSWYNSCFSSQRVCNFSWHSLFVYPNGEIKSCQFLQEPFGNVFEDNIIEVWNSEEYNRFRNLVGSKLLPGCSRCCKL
jgi:MoaA/NifB/PqqE/SkfB family radical SAM enzyme